MVNIEEFVSVIHNAVLRANETLLAENFKLIGQYFEVNNPEEFFGSEEWADFEEVKDMEFQEVVIKLETAVAEKHSTEAILSTIELLKKIQSRDEQVRNLGMKLRNLHLSKADSIRPKMITIQYPIHKEGKFTTTDIQVPLITLIPITLAELSEVRLKTNLIVEMNKDTGEVTVNQEAGILENLYQLPYKLLGETEAENSASKFVDLSSSIEIIVTPNKGSETLQLLINGFEKDLRAKIPS